MKNKEEQHTRKPNPLYTDTHTHTIIMYLLSSTKENFLF